MTEIPLFGVEQGARPSREEMDSPDAVLVLLGRLNRAILQSDNLEEMLRDFCTLLSRLRRYLVSWVGLLDDEGAGFRIVASSSDQLPPRGLEYVPLDARGPFCMLQALKQRETILIRDNQKSEFCRRCPFREIHPHRSTLAIPLVRHGKVLGGFVIHAPEADVFHDGEKRLLQDLADNLAYSIENAQSNRQKETMTENLRILQKITEITLRVSEPEKMLPRLAETLLFAMNVERCCLSTWDSCRERIGAFTSVTAEGVDQNKKCPALDAVEAIIQQEQPRMCDVEGYPVAEADRLQACSLAIPLHSNGKRVGVAYLHYGRSEMGNPSRNLNIDRAGEIMRHLALALDHALTVQANRKRLDTLLALHETGLDLARQLRVRSLLESIVRRAAQLMSSPWGGSISAFLKVCVSL